jgi:hypothetical protein
MRAELGDPAAHRLITHLDPALHEQFLDITEAEREAQVEPDGVGDDLTRETVPTVEAGSFRHGSSARVATAPSYIPDLDVTEPLADTRRRGRP